MPYRRHLAYAQYVIRHKWFVFVAGLRLGPPVDNPYPLHRTSAWLQWLYRLVIHDWDKFLPDEWFSYARTFYNRDGSKAPYAETYAFAFAWMLHQHRNRHHWQWYLNAGTTPLAQTNILVWDRGTPSVLIEDKIYDVNHSEPTVMWIETQFYKWPGQIAVREPMSALDRHEMLADWMGAGRAITGKWDTPSWYKLNREKMLLHPDTRTWIDQQLGVENT